LLGHRRIILAATSKLGGSPTATSEPTVRVEPPQDTAERRQVTVLFSDLVGSTALSARMDPEDLREVISAYQKCVGETVNRYDGFVAKYMGDGVLVYFGYPQAHEDDAERAGAHWAGARHSGHRAQDPRSSANPCRHHDWLGCCWRSGRLG
jgi:class 3 adenylate cyclase